MGVYRIFVVEDDPKIAAILSQHLVRYGYEAVVARRFHDLRLEFEEVKPQLVLLDVTLPSFDGFHWCRQIRAVSTVPIIFLTARSGDMDQVMAIEHGADDFLSKPFHLDVIMAKIKGALRRAYGDYAVAKPGGDAQDTVPLGEGLSWDRARFTLRSAEQSVALSRNESLLLEALVAVRGGVAPRESLLASLWDDADFVDDNTLTVNVNRLRRRFQDLGVAEAIETVRGLGYRLRSMDEVS